MIFKHKPEEAREEERETWEPRREGNDRESDAFSTVNYIVKKLILKRDNNLLLKFKFPLLLALLFMLSC